MGRLRVLVAVPVGWMVSSDFVSRMTAFAASSRMDVAILYEKSATRLDFSLSKIIAFAKRWGPDVLLRFDSDVHPNQDIETVVGLVRSDFKSGYDLVYSPTRSATFHIMSLMHDPKVCARCLKGTHLPPLGECSPSFFGALGYSALSPKLIEAYRPHIVEYGPPAMPTEKQTVRYLCTDWKNYDDYPDPTPGWERKTELSEVDPDLNTHVPMYVVNPPDNSEDADICFDIRSNGFQIGCDTRLLGIHLKRSGIANWGSDKNDPLALASMEEQVRKAEEREAASKVPKVLERVPEATA